MCVLGRETEQFEEGYSPLTVNDGKLEQINNEWEYDLDIPRLSRPIPLSIVGSSGSLKVSPHRDYYSFRAAIEQSFLVKLQTEAPLNLQQLYECLQSGEPDILRSLLLICLPNLTTLEYSMYWDNYYLEQTAVWAASTFLNGNYKHTAFRKLKSVHIKDLGSFRCFLSLVGAFMGLPNMKTVTVSRMNGSNYARIPQTTPSNATELTLIDHDISWDALDKLLTGGKPLKSFRSIVTESHTQFNVSTICYIYWSSLKLLELFELTKQTDTGVSRKGRGARFEKFAKLRELIVDYTFLDIYDWKSPPEKSTMADLLPYSLETLTLKTRGPTEKLFIDVLDTLSWKSLRFPRLRDLHLHAQFPPDKQAALRSACRCEGVNLSLLYESNKHTVAKQKYLVMLKV